MAVSNCFNVLGFFLVVTTPKSGACLNFLSNCLVLIGVFPKLCVTAYTMLENSRLQRIWGLILVSGPRKKETPSETISYVSSEVDEKES